MIARRTLVQGLLAATLVVGLVGFSSLTERYQAWLDEWGPGWHATAWPFLRDGFPPGRAWRNADVTVYVRLKLGFCGNCETGVVEDSEVDQVTDVDLLDEKFTPVGAGSRIRITDLFGRSRLYNIATKDGTRTAWAIAVNYKCDLIVALAVGRLDDPAMQKDVRAFLESDTVQVYVNAALEGR